MKITHTRAALLRMQTTNIPIFLPLETEYGILKSSLKETTVARMSLNLDGVLNAKRVHNSILQRGTR